MTRLIILEVRKQQGTSQIPSTQLDCESLGERMLDRKFNRGIHGTDDLDETDDTFGMQFQAGYQLIYESGTKGDFFFSVCYSH